MHRKESSHHDATHLYDLSSIERRSSGCSPRSCDAYSPVTVGTAMASSGARVYHAGVVLTPGSIAINLAFSYRTVSRRLLSSTLNVQHRPGSFNGCGKVLVTRSCGSYDLRQFKPDCIRPSWIRTQMHIFRGLHPWLCFLNWMSAGSWRAPWRRHRHLLQKSASPGLWILKILEGIRYLSMLHEF